MNLYKQYFTNRLLSKSRLMVDNNEVLVPHKSSSLSFDLVSSMLVQMSTSDGKIKLQWDGEYRVYLTLHPSFKTHVGQSNKLLFN